MTAASHYASKMRSKRRGRALDAQGMGAVLEDRLDQLIDLSSDVSPVWEGIGKIWGDRQRKVFETGSFGRWAPLAVSTIVQKRRQGVSNETLVHTHSLLGEVSREEPRSSSTHYVVFGPAKGAVIDYAKFHMRGMGVPQRHPVPRLTPTERKNMLKAFKDRFGFRP